MTLSSDPARDTPDVMRRYAGSSPPARRELSHVLKVFLIDRAGDVREEIYGSLFLHPQTVLNDINLSR